LFVDNDGRVIKASERVLLHSAVSSSIIQTRAEAEAAAVAAGLGSISQTFYVQLLRS